MSAPLIPQEIYLLERYTSLEYFKPVRDHWEAMVKHVEHCLEVFMQHLPPDYRDRPLPKQPDAVWGELVLPNFRDTLRSLFEAYIMVSHGELNGLGGASEVLSDQRGAAEFWYKWMDEPQVLAEVDGGSQKYFDLMMGACGPAGNIDQTMIQGWTPGRLTRRYQSHPRAPLNFPPRWPRYRINSKVRVRTGDRVPEDGIYLAEDARGCAQFQLGGDEAALVKLLIRKEIRDDGAEIPIYEEHPGLWTLVERVPNEFVASGLIDLLADADAPPIQNIAAGLACPRAGWWFTVAQKNSQRYFELGDIFPEIEGSDYGRTFWQWAPAQSG